MFCPACGNRIDAPSSTCPSCGAALPAEGAGSFPPPPAAPPGPVEKIPNYLVQAILVTVCCCVPFGIVAIVYAAQVNGRIALGDVATARRYSRLASIWSWVGFGVGLAGVLIYGVLVFLAGALGNR